MNWHISKSVLTHMLNKKYERISVYDIKSIIVFKNKDLTFC